MKYEVWKHKCEVDLRGMACERELNLTGTV
jgi:hypothetical protein